MSLARLLAIASVIAACSGRDGDDDGKPSPKHPPPAPPADAAIDGITAIGAHDPIAVHLDDAPVPVPGTPRPQPKRPGRPIEILLRSSPNGATVSVDGTAVGLTPTFWLGDTGAEHEFTFSLPKHALARYRFLPIASGTLHARLDPVATDVDAGVPPPEVMHPAPPIAPPETLVAPAPSLQAVDAAVTPPADAAQLLPPPPVLDAAPGLPSPAIGPQP